MSFPRYLKYRDSGVEWLGPLPEHWKCVPLWTCFRRIKRTGFDDEQLLSVYREHGVVPKASRDDNFNKPSDDLGAYQLVVPSDLVINKMKAWQGSVAISEHRGIVSPAYFVYTAIHEQNSRYLHYLMRSVRYITGYLSISKGIRVNQWDLEPQLHSRIPLPIPSAEEQENIAAFLDRETAKIDALVAEQRRLIELLKEKRQVVISHAVTKGLNPHAPMKDSGIEWLGEVPAHWEVRRLKYILRSSGLVRGPFGGDLKKETFQASGVKVYEQKNAIYRDCTIGDSFVSEAKFEQMKRFRVLPGDYIMSCSGTIGKAYRLPDDTPIGIINQALLIIRFSDRICSEFADWIFDADFFTTQILDNSQGGAMKNLVGMDIFTSVSLPVPPSAEQQSIGRYLTDKINELDLLNVEVERAIDLLEEHRTALISAAVTGQIDVRQLAEKQAAA